MNLDFLSPVNENVLEEIEQFHSFSLGKKTLFHSHQNGIPDFEKAQIAILGVLENRGESHSSPTQNFNLDALRLSFYKLFPGHWDKQIIDLGDILPGETLEDTRYALLDTLRQLIEKNIIPIILGGSQDLTYYQYRAYDYTDKMVNLVNIDAKFDIGNSESDLNDHTFVGKMIVDQPYNLFNYINIGYQSYLNPPEEIELIEKLYFEAYRLGNISADINLAEPALRDADMVSIDINSVASHLSKSIYEQPNGFDGKEICALARYAGISDRTSSFGLYNLQHINPKTAEFLLPAEIIWYFIEGVNYRKNEEDILTSKNYLKYSVPLDSEVLTFYKSNKSGRWWVEIPTYVNNKLKKPTFLPCSYQDYLEACNQEIPERWYKARHKNEI